MNGINIDAIHESKGYPIWPDGTRKSLNNDFNWKAPRAKVSPLTKFKAPQSDPMNTNFNVAFSENTPGALTSMWAVTYVNE